MLDRFTKPIDAPFKGAILFNKALEQESIGNISDAEQLYRLSSEHGETRAMVNLGAILIDGDEDQQKEAISFFQQAANYGNHSGMRNMGYVNAIGLGTSLNKEEGVRWYTLAAKNGNIKAQCNLAVMLRYGNGVEQNHEEAAVWYKRSAEAGYFRAQATLGTMYLNGEGMEPDPEQAFYWFGQAATNGSSRGMYNLALLYLQGIGTEQDIEKATELLETAVNKGYSKAMFTLGQMLLAEGKKERAVELFNAGAAKGENRCVDALISMNMVIPEYTGRKKKKKQ